MARRESAGTPAIVAARQAGITFHLHRYHHDSLAGSYGLEAAEALGIAPELIFKTLLAEVDTQPVCAVVPVESKLDLKALAATHGGKRASMMEPARAERLTGYVVGGISPLGQQTRLATYIDDTADTSPTMYISAGKRGLEIELACSDLLTLTSGKLLRLRAG